MDGERQQLETFRKKLADARRRGFHFELVWSGYITRRQSYECGEDRQTAFRLYIVDVQAFLQNWIQLKIVML